MITDAGAGRNKQNAGEKIGNAADRWLGCRRYVWSF
jgi:hypothetical protein